MAKKQQPVTLYHPDGRKAPPTSDPVEITNLRSYGYTETDPTKNQQSTSAKATGGRRKKKTTSSSGS